jgi:hypothetical protein
MAVRVKSRWHQDGGERSPEEIASAAAFICWRLALDKAINLHGKDFVYRDDDQRLDVIVEYLIFMLQLVDRQAEQRFGLDVDQRRALINAMARKLAQHVQDNSSDLLGPGEYRNDFVRRINERGAEYAEFNYGEDGPSYPFLRHLGHEIQQVMGVAGENRWVIDQVMDVDGPELEKALRKALGDLFEF